MKLSIHNMGHFTCRSILAIWCLDPNEDCQQGKKQGVFPIQGTEDNQNPPDFPGIWGICLIVMLDVIPGEICQYCSPGKYKRRNRKLQSDGWNWILKKQANQNFSCHGSIHVLLYGIPTCLALLETLFEVNTLHVLKSLMKQSYINSTQCKVAYGKIF